jgi:hypothetical protein
MLVDNKNNIILLLCFSEKDHSLNNISYLEDYGTAVLLVLLLLRAAACRRAAVKPPRPLPISRPHAVRRCAGRRWAALESGVWSLVALSWSHRTLTPSLESGLCLGRSAEEESISSLGPSPRKSQTTANSSERGRHQTSFLV